RAAVGERAHRLTPALQVAVPPPSFEAARNSLAAFVSVSAQRVGAPFTAFWCLLAGWQVLRLWRASAWIARLKRGAVPLAEPAPALSTMARAVRRARIGLSDGVRIPCAVGYWAPMVLLPSALTGR